MTRDLRGQGMLEMIIALGIIVSGITGTLALVSGSLNASNESQTRIVATGLAREAMEAVRAMRDTSWRDGLLWNASLVGPGSDRTAVPVLQIETQKGWTLNFAAGAMSDDVSVVRTDATGFFRQYMGSPPGAGETPYRRMLTLWPICMVEGDAATMATVEGATCPAGQMEIGTDARVEIDWTVSGRGHALKMEETLYDWR